MHPEPPLARFGGLRRHTNPAAPQPAQFLEATTALAQAPAPSDAGAAESDEPGQAHSAGEKAASSSNRSPRLAAQRKCLRKKRAPRPSSRQHTASAPSTVKCSHALSAATVKHRHGPRRRPRRESTAAPESTTTRRASPVRPNPSFKPSTNGVPRGPGWRYPVHFRHPGPRVPPSVPS